MDAKVYWLVDPSDTSVRIKVINFGGFITETTFRNGFPLFHEVHYVH